MSSVQEEDIVIIGAGPCGLSAAAELQDQGFDPLVIEKENVVNSIASYPTYLEFFSTPEMLEIANIPFVSPHEKPNRLEALNYYRTVAERKKLRIRRYEEATAIVPEGKGFRIESTTKYGGERLVTHARVVVVATGYFDHPNRLGIPGEHLPHVTHFFKEAHPYAGTKVVIIGGSNSAVDAALELMRVGASVTVVYRGESVSDNIKPWVKPIFESFVAKGRIDLRLRSRVVAIEPARVTVRTNDEAGSDGAARTDSAAREKVEADFVLALTGFRPNRAFLRAIGVEAPEGNVPPTHDEVTMETNVPGLYLAGVVATGRDANEIFIESGRNHGKKIAAHLASLRDSATAFSSD
ncbi:YpdA family putative bacillithiol disulfide reductase [Cohnella faecalis]|uniref:YpdA family putative bacillithiol disulfide reductase n=1 Tax=Cohnella faecalis TaxID=2315694 RepID=A0A398CMI7_9BACL|nr:YpdA family putative bacillithiol disulfide reductase [Cohnella faecalis]RIE01998.1 YpdA family putative bacillithiol disulfide reductase [Cohnella faecalis]